MGAGSCCFTDELPGAGFDGKVRIRDTWGHLNSQESIDISPEMFAEFVYPYCAQTAAEYGLV
ncbi:MAG: uroporphyrinogen decarboxylase family protein, partial [Treponema sp.]|nr:uroporphyrinogen decarboxylase family protein [Treponema sp.]